MAKKKAKLSKAAIRTSPEWVKVTDSQKRKVAKNLDYRLKSTHLGTISKRQVPRGRERGIYNRLWPLISPQSFRHYVPAAYMAVPDIDRSIEDWDDNCLFSDKQGNQWPRFYVIETFNYERQDLDQAPEEPEKPVTSAMHGFRTLEEDLLFELDELNKPYLKPRIRELDEDYDPLDDEPQTRLFKDERKVETLADMFGCAGYVGESEKAVFSQTVTKEYQILIPGTVVEAYSAFSTEILAYKKRHTGIECRKKALELLAKGSVLCYPTFCALMGKDGVSIQAFTQMLRANGYYRAGTVGKTAIYRPWSEIYPEGVPAYVLGKDEAGEVPA